MFFVYLRSVGLASSGQNGICIDTNMLVVGQEMSSPHLILLIFMEKPWLFTIIYIYSLSQIRENWLILMLQSHTCTSLHEIIYVFTLTGMI
jgi:hypothetical protein